MTDIEALSSWLTSHKIAFSRTSAGLKCTEAKGGFEVGIEKNGDEFIVFFIGKSAELRTLEYSDILAI